MKVIPGIEPQSPSYVGTWTLMTTYPSEVLEEEAQPQSRGGKVQPEAPPNILELHMSKRPNALCIEPISYRVCKCKPHTDPTSSPDKSGRSLEKH